MQKNIKAILLSLLMIAPYYAHTQVKQVSKDSITTDTLPTIIDFGMDHYMKPYKIYSTVAQKTVSIDDIINDMDNADVLFFGEEHDNPTGHIIEWDLLKKLTDKYPGKSALSMEMFETDVQTVLNEYLKGAIREKDMVKDARAWPNYKTDYRNLIELAKSTVTPVVAANSPARYTHIVTDKGLINLQQLNKAALQFLPPLPIDTATGPYYEKFIKIMGGHSAMGNMHIYQSQNLWDATMAWSIAKFFKSHRGYKIMQINGGFHSEDKLGTVSQLKKYAPKARTITVAAYADDTPDKPDWGKYRQTADYIILINK